MKTTAKESQSFLPWFLQPPAISVGVLSGDENANCFEIECINRLQGHKMKLLNIYIKNSFFSCAECIS